MKSLKLVRRWVRFQATEEQIISKASSLSYLNVQIEGVERFDGSTGRQHCVDGTGNGFSIGYIRHKEVSSILMPNFVSEYQN